MAVVKRVGPASAFKLGLLVYAVLGLMAGVFFSLIALPGLRLAVMHTYPSRVLFLAYSPWSCFRSCMGSSAASSQRSARSSTISLQAGSADSKWKSTEQHKSTIKLKHGTLTAVEDFTQTPC